MVDPGKNGEDQETKSTTYDRHAELKAFDETKVGVKGLVDSGVTKVPRIFIHPPHNLDKINTSDTDSKFPVIDLDGFDKDPVKRERVVEEIRVASETWGFFQVVNHGIPIGILEEMLDGVLRFNEQAPEIRKKYYSRDYSKTMAYNCNFDLYSSPAANWRDSFYCAMAPRTPQPEELPAVCREILIEFSNHIMKLGCSLFILLSEALGLSSKHLIDMGSADALAHICHYYPACPEPELTIGTTQHSDNDFMTVLLQDNVGGLQVRHQNQWVDVPPTPGALVVNHGDLLQLISNDKFKSVEHRVLASQTGPRISVASFFGRDSGTNARVLAPVKELLSEHDPPKYRATTASEYTEFYRRKGLDGTSALVHFRL
ncbi:1-aminocyclopropane-1-carboxylate oxidase homolog 1-like [Primulina tabacum]|uniref:1-aminocyclopropane-1-carboxylate oxidase homolog 1-like n=1 Tax=Primulina tabacum TaxID=48773 RepID=UPI003F5A7819